MNVFGNPDQTAENIFYDQTASLLGVSNVQAAIDALDFVSDGDVAGPGGSTDNAIARFDGTTGKLIQNSTATISDVGLLNATSYAENGDAISGIKTGLGGAETYVMGSGAGAALTTAQNNILIGTNAGAAITNAPYQVVIGTDACTELATNGCGVYIGDLAGQYLTGGWNCVVGANAGIGTTGISTGGKNTLIGDSAGTAVTTGGENTCVGYVAGGTIETGDYNTCVGRAANVATSSFTNCTALGYNAICSVSNQITLGDANVTQIRCSSDAACDLGSATNQFKDLHISGNVVGLPVYFQLAASDETTALTTGTAKVTFRAPHAFTLTEVRASLTTAQTSGSIFTVDINKNGTTVLSTKVTIDNAERTSTTAATAPVISVSAITDDDELSIDIDQVGDGTAKGLKVALIGTRS